jgi:predicted amidophosphoribosyltransferase
MLTLLRTFRETGLDWVLGQGCAICDQSPAPQAWCATHWREVGEQERARLRCRQCALPASGQSGLAQARICAGCLSRPSSHIATYVGADYAAPWDELVKALKFSGKIDKAGALVALLDAALPPSLALDLLVPVPTWPAKLAQRGFNAPAVVGAALALRRGWGFDALALQQQRELPLIHLLKAAERALAVQGAFAPRRDLSGLRVGLIDDVMTTGATLQAASAALRAAGARQVVLLAALRTPKEA